MRQLRKAKQASSENASPERHRGAAGVAARAGRPRVRIVTAVLLVTFVSLIAVSTFAKLSGWGEQPRGPSAAIVDQLSLTFPDPGFVESAARTLEEVGYEADYYPGQEVTVDFYQDLLSRGYQLIILRVHSSVSILGSDPPTVTDNLALFTSEAYRPAGHVAEQRAGRVTRVAFDADGAQYFGVYADFLESLTSEQSADTTIVLMGCDGLRFDKAARAFLHEGAQTVIGWDGGVSAAHTDAATEHLLQHLLIDRLPVGEAVAQTMADVGPDPAYGSSLLFYPPESVAGGPEEAYLAP